MFETAARIDQAVSIEPDDDLRPARKQGPGSESPERSSRKLDHRLPSDDGRACLALPAQSAPRTARPARLMKPRVFGYGSSTGYNTRWKTICKRAGHHRTFPRIPAGRHGFFTELVVRQGVDPVTAAKAGRWSDPNLPMRIYAHAETDEADVRARFRTNHVQEDPVQTPKQQKSKKEKRK